MIIYENHVVVRSFVQSRRISSVNVVLDPNWILNLCCRLLHSHSNNVLFCTQRFAIEEDTQRHVEEYSLCTRIHFIALQTHSIYQWVSRPTYGKRKPDWTESCPRFKCGWAVNDFPYWCQWQNVSNHSNAQPEPHQHRLTLYGMKNNIRIVNFTTGSRYFCKAFEFTILMPTNSNVDDRTTIADTRINAIPATTKGKKNKLNRHRRNVDGTHNLERFAA